MSNIAQSTKAEKTPTQHKKLTQIDGWWDDTYCVFYACVLDNSHDYYIYIQTSDFSENVMVLWCPHKNHSAEIFILWKIKFNCRKIGCNF